MKIQTSSLYLAALGLIGGALYLAVQNRTEDLKKDPAFAKVSSAASDQQAVLLRKTKIDNSLARRGISTDSGEASPRLHASSVVERVVAEARERLRSLEASHGTAGRSPQERQAFAEQLRLLSPEERHRLIMERREQALAQREAFENQLSPKQKAERERYRKLIRLSSMLHSLSRLGWAEEMRSETESLEYEIMNFAMNTLEVDDNHFQQNWARIETKNHQLREKFLNLRQASILKKN